MEEIESYPSSASQPITRKQVPLPLGILIVSSLLILVGLFAAFEIAYYGLLNTGSTGFNLNLNLLFFPLGLGLLVGINSVRHLLRILFWISYAFMAYFLFRICTEPSGLYATWNGRRFEGAEVLPFAVVSLLLFWGIVILIHRTLSTDRADAYFAA